MHPLLATGESNQVTTGHRERPNRRGSRGGRRDEGREGVDEPADLHGNLELLEVDAHGLVLSIGPALLREVGYGEGELLGKSAFALVAPDDREAVSALFEQVAAERRPAQLRLRSLTRDGTSSWIEAMVRPHKQIDGETRFVVAVRDISECVALEDELERQANAERSSAELSRSLLKGLEVSDFEGWLEVALGHVADLACADHCFLVQLDGDSTPGDARIGGPVVWNAPGDAGGFVRGQGSSPSQPWLEARLLAGEVVHLPELDSLPPEAVSERRALEDRGVSAHLGLPVHFADELVAYLAFDRVAERRRGDAPASRGRGWSEQEIARLQLVAEVLVSVLRHRRAEEERRGGDFRFRTVAEQVQDIICEFDSTGRPRYVSAAAERLLGFSSQEIMQLGRFTLVHPEDVALVKAAQQRIFAEAGEGSVTFRTQKRDGSWIWLESAARSYLDASGQLIAVSVLRDVSERLQETERLHRQVAYQSLISRLSRDLLAVDGASIDATIEAGLAEVARVARADRALFLSTVAEIDSEWAGFEWRPEGRPSFFSDFDVRGLDRFAWCHAHLARGEVVRVEGIDDLPSEASPELADLRRRGVHAALMIPTHAHGKLVGFLGLVQESPSAIVPHEGESHLRLIAELFSSTLRRKANEAALRVSDERFRAIADSSKDGICELDQEGRYIYASASYGEFLGLAPEMLLGRSSGEYIHRDDIAKVYHAWKRALEGHPTEAMVYRVRHEDGSWRHLEATGTVLGDEKGEQRVMCVMRDVTERERSREMLMQQLDLEGRVAELSRYFLDLTIDEIESAVSDRLADLAELANAEHSCIYLFPKERGGAMDVYEWWDSSVSEPPAFDPEFAPNRYPWTFEQFRRGETIQIIDMDDLPEAAAPERGDLLRRGIRAMLGIPLISGGRSVGYLGFETLSDRGAWQGETITLVRLAGEIFVAALDRRRAEMELRASQQQLLQSQKMEAVGRLAGGIAHDFNNHLAVMLGNARYVSREVTSDPEVVDALTDLVRSAEHCSQLTRSLLAFSRRSPVQVGPLEVASLVSEIHELVRPLIPSSIDVAFGHDPDVGAVSGDPTHLQQVLVNLIVNARDAMPNGGRLTVHAERRHLQADEAVALGLAEAGTYVALVVSDTGIGMTPEVREHIFEPFYTTKDLGKGTGLGLATVYGIVEQCDGAIAVESELGEGTEFCVLLPAIEEAAAGDFAREDASAATGSETILVVEDEPGVQRLVGRVLEREGYRVLIASDGEAALETMQAQGPAVDALLSDLVMPGIGGVELATRLRNEHPELRILFLSGSCLGSEEEIASQVPGARFVEKPFEAAVLVQELRSLLDA